MGKLGIWGRTIIDFIIKHCSLPIHGNKPFGRNRIGISVKHYYLLGKLGFRAELGEVLGENTITTPTFNYVVIFVQ